MAMATFCLWIANLIVSQTFPMMDENSWLIERFNHGFPFWVYGFFCVILVAVMGAIGTFGSQAGGLWGGIDTSLETTAFGN